MTSGDDTRVLARGQGASPGIATGEMALTAEDVVRRAAAGAQVVFVRVEIEAEDAPGIRAAAGTVATRGGITSDAAIIARSLGKPCLVGCSTLFVDYKAGEVRVTGGPTLRVGQVITIDGSRGLLLEG